MIKRSYDWRDVTLPNGYTLYAVTFYEAGRSKGTITSEKRGKLQEKVQDWMDGKPVEFVRSV